MSGLLTTWGAAILGVLCGGVAAVSMLFALRVLLKPQEEPPARSMPPRRSSSGVLRLGAAASGALEHATSDQIVRPDQMRTRGDKDATFNSEHADPVDETWDDLPKPEPPSDS